jgi:predicted pyridoxine 5'-phosphate oxidase superfamily flavin-nucleotide-binding protein
MIEAPFHAGELLAQHLAGGGPPGSGIRDYMPDQHRLFFAGLRYAVLSTADAEGWPVATMLAGAPGFIQSPDATTLHVALPVPASDPALDSLTEGREVGLLGLDLVTRRRNRANGHLARRDADGLSVHIEQSFGNCPQYIQRRSVQPMPRQPGAVEAVFALDDPARSLITGADTFFIATRSANGLAGGADISHRGGRPGFVRIVGDTLWVPDFRGNRYFNTLGNLLNDRRAAVLFVDFQRGDLLQLQGVVEVDWTSDAALAFPGAERLWRFRVERGWRRAAGIPLAWSYIDASPFTERTGIWTDVP